ncbi:MAG: aminoacyl-tRNA hydrolase [Amoebophilaceae bacterium]|nr:aminoacyl-tRNA hydrolase [Amoebophilaceae bacterium]
MKWLLVGLGNIGMEYTYTRHNIGFLVVDHLAHQQKAAFKSAKWATMASFTHKNHTVYMIKPTTYMNNSGEAVRYWLKQLAIPMEQSVMIVDDIALPFGKVRLRPQGSDSGHNGLKSISACLQSNNYPRLRMGIGSDFPKGQLANFVLGDFSPKEQEELPFQWHHAGDILLTLCNAGIVHAMNQFNKTK